MEHSSWHRVVGKVGVGVVVGARCGGRPGEHGGFSVVDRVESMGEGRVEGEQEPIGGYDDA